jgi:hypothetical protein
MSDVLTVEPPPPPPPPPPSSPSSTIDFVRPFAFAFEDPRWLPKMLIGALFTLATFLLIGLPFVLGYMARLARNVVAGMQQPLPEWDDLGEYFTEGLRLFVIAFLYLLPIFVIVGMVVVPLIFAQSLDRDSVQRAVSEGFVGCVWCLVAPLSLAINIWLPAALIMSAVDRDFGAAFDFSRIARFIRANAGSYVLAFIVWLIARFAASLGILLFCVGVFVTAFWSYLVGTYAFAEAYRLSKSR